MAQKIYGNLELRSNSLLKLFEAAANGTSSVQLKSPAALGADREFTLPGTVAADDVLTSDASGVMSFVKLANANISASAAIAYSKLNLSASIVDADIATAAAISLSKLAALTASRALVSDSSGVISVSTTTATELGYVSGVTSSIQTQLGGKASTALDNLTVSGLAAESLLVGSSSSAVTALPVGTEGQVLKVVSGVVAWGTDSASAKFAATWTTADGTSKTVTHNLGTKDVIVQIYDMTDDATILVDSVVRTSTNVVTLTASEAPGASSWRVVIIA